MVCRQWTIVIDCTEQADFSFTSLGLQMGDEFGLLVSSGYGIMVVIGVSGRRIIREPYITPWSNNARQWPAEEREVQRNREGLTLQFLAMCCFLQMLLSRSYIIEQPHGSDLFESHALSPITGAHAYFPHHAYVFDQCALGATMDGCAIRK